MRSQSGFDFNQSPCYKHFPQFLGLDIQDEMGRHEVGAVEETAKLPINNKEGCMFAGTFYINKVPGNFHMSTHATGRHDIQPNFQHILHELSFGDQLTLSQRAGLPGGSFNPMFQVDQTKAEAIASHEYILKIVPTVYETISGQKTYLYQYTYAHKTYIGLTHGHSIIPAVWFRYDLTPITVKYVERRAPLYTFITAVCAVVGGAFTVAGIIDSMVFSAAEIIKKLEIGKLS